VTLSALSASQVEEFDPDQVSGCPRRWYYRRIGKLPVPESDRAREDGDAGHAHFALYYRTGQRPRRARMSKAVNGALDAGRLPAREPGQLIESRFDGQTPNDRQQSSGVREPLRTSSTLWLGAVPWDGYVDLRFYREGTITVLDHKFSSDIHAYAKRDLLATVQMPVYALDSLRLWPGAERVELIHNYVSRCGVDSFLVRQNVTAEQVRQRGQEIEGLVRRMQAAAQAPSAEDVPGNRNSCHMWTGCPFQSRCTVFKEKPKMNLNPDELEWLNVPAAAVPGAAEELKAKKEEPRGAYTQQMTEEFSEEQAKIQAAIDAKTSHSADELSEPAEISSAAGALDPTDDPFAVFAPVASVPEEQPARPPSCSECGTELRAENGSQKDGKWKHIGCPAEQATPSASGPKCPDCPHPAHHGAACTRKRGRGACRCGQSVAAAAVEQARCEKDHGMTPGGYTARVPLGAEPLVAESDMQRAVHPAGPDADHPMLVPHLPTCVQNDGGKWLCMDGCTAGETAEPVKVPETKRWNAAEPNPPGNLNRAPGFREIDAGPVPAPSVSGWTGTLRVEVNLGPDTLALIQRLIGGWS